MQFTDGGSPFSGQYFCNKIYSLRCTFHATYSLSVALRFTSGCWRARRITSVLTCCAFLFFPKTIGVRGLLLFDHSLWLYYDWLVEQRLDTERLVGDLFDGCGTPPAVLRGMGTGRVWLVPALGLDDGFDLTSSTTAYRLNKMDGLY